MPISQHTDRQELATSVHGGIESDYEEDQSSMTEGGPDLRASRSKEQIRKARRPFLQRRNRVRLPENSVRNPFENFGILCAKIFRPLDERGSAQKDAKISKTRWPGEPRASSKNLARWRPCRLPLPSTVGAISPASFEHEYPGRRAFFGCDMNTSEFKIYENCQFHNTLTVRNLPRVFMGSTNIWLRTSE